MSQLSFCLKGIEALESWLKMKQSISKALTPVLLLSGGGNKWRVSVSKACRYNSVYSLKFASLDFISNKGTIDLFYTVAIAA